MMGEEQRLPDQTGVGWVRSGGYPPAALSSAPETRRMRQHQHRVGIVSAVAVALAFAATSTGCASLGKPQWLDPGPARNQQRRAVRFDPFMQNDIGPSLFRQYSTLDGTRPRDYAEPVPEVRRSRWWSQPAR